MKSWTLVTIILIAVLVIGFFVGIQWPDRSGLIYEPVPIRVAIPFFEVRQIHRMSMLRKSDPGEQGDEEGLILIDRCSGVTWELKYETSPGTGDHSEVGLAYGPQHPASLEDG